MAAGLLDQLCWIGEAYQYAHDDDKHHAADPFGGRELPAHEQVEDDAELDDQIKWARSARVGSGTVQGYFYDWRDNGLFENINFALLIQAREAAGREPSPSAGVIDSQSA